MCFNTERVASFPVKYLTTTKGKRRERLFYSYLSRDYFTGSTGHEKRVKLLFYLCSFIIIFKSYRVQMWCQPETKNHMHYQQCKLLVVVVVLPVFD